MYKLCKFGIDKSNNRQNFLKYTKTKRLGTIVKTSKGILITDSGSVLVLANNNNPWWEYKTNTVAKYLTN